MQSVYYTTPVTSFVRDVRRHKGPHSTLRSLTRLPGSLRCSSNQSLYLRCNIILQSIHQPLAGNQRLLTGNTNSPNYHRISRSSVWRQTTATDRRLSIKLIDRYCWCRPLAAGCWLLLLLLLLDDCWLALRWTSCDDASILMAADERAPGRRWVIS